MFVRHALDPPWVESSMDVLVVAVPIMVRHFLPIACEAPPLAAQKWPIPPTKRPKVLHWVISWILCAVNREADVPGQVWICAQGYCLWWLTIFPALCSVEVPYPTRKAPDLSGWEYLCSPLPEP